jgi:hypothetical protein
MKNGQIKSFRDTVMQTDSFKSWTKIVQKISLTRNNLSHIEHGYTVAKNLGYKKWSAQCNFSFRNKELVQELLNN